MSDVSATSEGILEICCFIMNRLQHTPFTVLKYIQAVTKLELLLFQYYHEFTSIRHPIDISNATMRKENLNQEKDVKVGSYCQNALNKESKCIQPVFDMCHRPL